MEHSFDVEVAKEFGVIPAILLRHIEFWIAKNKANGKHFHDGTYWTYSSIKALTELFPYLSAKQIEYALKKLIDKKMLKTGNFNANSYDRTLWYAFDENYVKWIPEKTKIHFTNFGNGNPEIVEPIPDIITDTITDDTLSNTYIKTVATISNTSDIKKSENIDYIINDRVDESAKKKRATSQIPPSLEDVKAYVAERGNVIDAERFCDFYECKGWKVGRDKMKDWRAAVRTWERRGKSEAQSRNTQPRDPFLDFLDDEIQKGGGA